MTTINTFSADILSSTVQCIHPCLTRKSDVVYYDKCSYILNYRFDNYQVHVKINDVNTELCIWDTDGQEDFDRIRPLSYYDTVRKS